MKKKPVPWVLIIVLGGILVVTVVVSNFISSRKQVYFTKASAGIQVKIELDPLLPIDVQAELDNPLVQKILIKNHQGELEIDVPDSSSDGIIRQGKTDLVHLPNNVDVKISGDGLELDYKKIKSTTTFPIAFNKLTNQIVVDMAGGPRYIKILPNEAMEIGKSEINGEVKKMEIVGVNKSGIGDDVAFKITGLRSGYFLGLFPVDTNIETAVGAQSGVVLETKEPVWLKFLSPLISVN